MSLSRWLRPRSNFTKYWTASAISYVGDGAMIAAGPLLVASQTQNPVLVSGAVFAQQLPWMLFTLTSGAYTDRLDRRRILIAADILRTAAVGGLAIACWFGSETLPLVYLALFLLGTGNVFADNTATALLPSIVHKESLTSANSKLQGTNIIGRQLAGPTLGAFLFGMAAAFPLGLDAVTFLIAALLVWRMRIGHHKVEATTSGQPRSVRNQIAEGLQWLHQHTFLRTLAITTGVLNFTYMAAFSSFVLFAEQRLGLGPLEYGAILSLGALGGLVGTFAVKPLQNRFHITVLLRAGLIVEALINLAFAFIQSPWLAGCLYAIFGLHAVVWGVITVSLRQKLIPSHLLGRVNSVYNLSRMGGIALGSLIGGHLAQTYGLAAPFWIATGIIACLTTLAWRRLVQSP